MPSGDRPGVFDAGELVRHSHELCERTRDLCHAARLACAQAFETVEDARRLIGRSMHWTVDEPAKPPEDQRRR